MSQNKILVFLLIVILILGGIFAFKVVNKNDSNNTIENKVVQEQGTLETNDEELSSGYEWGKNKILDFILIYAISLVQGTSLPGLIISIILYVLMSIGIMKLLEEEDMPAWLAWIPIIQNLLLIQIGYQNRTTVWIAVVCMISSVLLSKIFMFMPILSLTAFIPAALSLYLYFGALYKIYNAKSYSPTLLLILSIISFGLLAPLFIFLIRNN